MAYRYSRIMVGLDFTPLDQTLIEYASFLASVLKPKQIYFVNAQKGLEDPEELLADYPELDAPIDEKLRDELWAEVNQYFKPMPGTQIECLILEGSPSSELHDYVQIKKIDLLLVGRKKSLKGTGAIPQKLARKVPASLLFVPEQATPVLRTILVPLDYSSHSQMALEEAIALAVEDPAENKVVTLHAYGLPTGYYKTGKTEEEFAAVLHANIIKKHSKFIEAIDTKGIEIMAEYVFDDEHSAAEVANYSAQQMKADLIVIGGKGRTNASALFLGSTAERMIALDNTIPLLVVKDKKATFGFLEMLKQL